MNNMYMQNILDHFHNPENSGTMEDATHVHVGHNPFCGDKITVYLKVKDDILEDVRFVGEGCAISQAGMSMLSEVIKSRAVNEVLDLSKDDVVEMMGIDLSPTRLKCALLGLDAVKEALAK